MSITEPSSPIDWSKFSEAGFSADVKWLWRVIQKSGRQEHDAGHDKKNIHDTVTYNQRYFHSFVRAPLWYIDTMSFWVLRVTLLVFCGCPSISTERHPPRHLTVGQLLYSSDCRVTGRAAQKIAKATFWFGSIVPKQLTLYGFLQHTSANTIYIWNNKISQQLKILHVKKNASMCDTFFKRVHARTQLLS